MPKPLSDRTILNWLQRKLSKPGTFDQFSFSDSRDMGYRENFLSFWKFRYQPDGTELKAKGNSVRDVLSKAIRAERAQK